jgi:hypothetical protein
MPPADNVWDLPIRLIGGGQALLRVPVPLSEENYNLLRKVVDLNLELQKPALMYRKPEGFALPDVLGGGRMVLHPPEGRASDESVGE